MKFVRAGANFVFRCELVRQELQKRIKKLALTPKQMPDGVVLKVSEDVGLIREPDGMLQSSLKGIAQHYTFVRIRRQPFLLLLHSFIGSRT
jgi:hypothetical protein